MPGRVNRNLFHERGLELSSMSVGLEEPRVVSAEYRADAHLRQSSADRRTSPSTSSMCL